VSKQTRVAVISISLLFVLCVPAAASAVVYRPPVGGNVIDSFRPPATPYGPGNRGWEYATTPGSPVRSAADGVVTFTGQVGGVLNVVVRHDDGVLTTYSKLQSIAVGRGQQVHAGDVVGAASADVYFGARCDGSYFDPALLFTARIHLVPNDGGASTPGAPEATGCDRGSASAPALVDRAQVAWLAGETPPPDYWPSLRTALIRLHL
jgi:hypothetical protein